MRQLAVMPIGSYRLVVQTPPSFSASMAIVWPLVDSPLYHTGARPNRIHRAYGSSNFHRAATKSLINSIPLMYAARTHTHSSHLLKRRFERPQVNFVHQYYLKKNLYHYAQKNHIWHVLFDTTVLIGR